MGLVYADGKYTTLTDILGAEDAFGDMDFKVAGTADFVTALQLDTKIDGLPADVLAQALQQAYEARMQILEVMAEAIAGTARRGGRDRPEDRQLRDPDRQDRRGHRPEGQGHQRHHHRDRRRRQRRRRRHGRHGVDRLDRQGCGRRGQAPDRAHPQPADRRGRARSTRAGSSTSPSSVRSSTSSRAATACSTSPRSGGGKRIDRVEDVLDLGDEVEVRVDDVDPSGKVSPLAWPPAPEPAARWSAATAGSVSAAAGAGRSSSAESVELRGQLRRRAVGRPRRPRAGHGRVRRGPGRPGRARRRPRPRRPPAPPVARRIGRGHRQTDIRETRLGNGIAHRHRAHAGGPLGDPRRLGRRRGARRARRPRRRLALPRAPAVQGDRPPAAPARSPRRSTRSAAR